jgi:iron complex outermembrane recepter protein
MRLTKKKLLMLSALAAQAGAGVALAQDSSSGANTLEEITVTATRVATDVQDIPLAITAFSAEGLEKQNIEGLEDLTGTVPNILIAGDNGGTTGGSFYMRGIPNVGVYLDGIWQVSNNGLLTRDFVELDRIEVLRGPQGTLYGRDSTGGSIHIHSKKPTNEFGLNGSMQVGNLDRRDVMLSANIPLGDKISTKWTISDNHQDGWVKSLTTGNKDGNMDSRVIRGDVLFTPTDNLSFRFIHQQDNQVGRQARVQARIDFNVAYYHGYQVGIAEAHDIASRGGFNPISAVAGFDGGQLGRYESRISSTQPNEQYLKQSTIHADWDVNENVHVKYMFGDSAVDASIYNDWGGSQYNFFVNYDTSKLNLKSHELQITGDLLDKKVSYVVGGYKWKQDFRNRGVEWTMNDWTLAAPNSGTIQTLNYATVLASPACQRTPAQVGRSFVGQPNWLGQTITTANTVAGWPFPCDWAGGNGWIGAFAGPGGGVTSDRLGGATQDGNAFFGEATWNVTDAWSVTGGFRRHSQDNVSQGMALGSLARSISSGVTEARPVELNTLFDSRGAAVAGTFDVSNPSSFSATTLRFSTSYHINDSVMLYGGYSEGFNSGGVSRYFDSLPDEIVLPYSPENIENLEIGLRADLLDRSLRVNATAFRTDWNGIQYLSTVKDRATGQEVTELILQNLANGRAQGVELETTWLATDALSLNANLGFLKTKYLSSNNEAVLPSSSDFARAPSKTLNFAAQYKWSNVFGGNLVGRLQSNYWGAYWRASTLELRQDFQGLQTEEEAGDLWQHNARLTWTPDDDKYEVSAWINNISDSYNYNSGFMHGIWQFDFATVDRPREYGVMFKVRF